jgi:aryl-alcohol dehydrogenase-like predicted oxidoreductase
MTGFPAEAFGPASTRSKVESQNCLGLLCLCDVVSIIIKLIDADFKGIFKSPNQSIRPNHQHIMNYGSFESESIILSSQNSKRSVNKTARSSFVVVVIVATIAVSSISPFIKDVQSPLLGKSNPSEVLIPNPHAYPRRPFITHNGLNITIPVMGFPSAALAPLHEEADQVLANEIIRHAVEDLSISYFDVAPEYGDGTAQSRLGPALEPYRENVFLAAKTMYRAAHDSAIDLSNTLKALKTDHLDLYQFHSISTEDDVNTILGKDGAMETFQQAKRDGVIKAIGFSAHSEAMAVRMIESGMVDTCMFPINFAAYHFGGVGQKVLDAAIKHNVGVIALKSGARGRLTSHCMEVQVPDSFKHIPEWKRKEMIDYPVRTSKVHPTEWYEPEDDIEMLHKLTLWSLDQPGVSAILPPASLDLLDGISDMLRGKSEVPPFDQGDVEMMMERYADLVPIFHNRSISGTKVST